MAAPRKRGRGTAGVHRPAWDPRRKRWRAVLTYKTPDGRTGRHEVVAVNQADCLRKLNAAKEQVAKYGTPVTNNPTVAAFAARWLAEVAAETHTPNAYDAARASVNHQIVPTIGKRRIQTLLPSHVTAMRKTLEAPGFAGDGKTLSASVVKHAHSTLNRICDYAVAERVIPDNPARKAERTRQASQPTTTERQALTSDQLLAVIRASIARGDVFGILTVFKALTGLRQSEALGATLADLQLDAERTTVNGETLSFGAYTVNWQLQDLRREHGCGNPPDDPNEAWRCGYRRHGWCPEATWRVPSWYEKRQLKGALHLVRPKMSKIGKVVPLIPQLTELLRLWAAATKDQPNPHGLLFHHADGTPVIPKLDDRAWLETIHAAEVINDATLEAIKGKGGPTLRSMGLTGHISRHTLVTLLGELEVPTAIISRIVRHTDERTTDGYRHPHVAELTTGMGRLAAVIPTLAIEPPKPSE
ncbi:MAG: tyrosine-type recombinase/integrase [Micrococcales bacterium]|nr:tyrosine-type recombinase/integrase [Micrococcales bacterium]